LQIVKDLLDDHLKSAREIIQNKAILEPLERQIEYDCVKLKSFLEAAQVKGTKTCDVQCSRNSLILTFANRLLMKFHHVPRISLLVLVKNSHVALLQLPLGIEYV
jgi:hypothetical protein